MEGLFCFLFVLLLACRQVAAETPRVVSAQQNITFQQPSSAVPDRVGATAAACLGVPSSSPYISWTCAAVTPDGAQCTGQCLAGTKSPYGSPVAVCQDGQFVVGTSCMAGGVYNFDDVATDGSLPSSFLGLIWTGLRVVKASTFTACDGRNGFRYGVISGPNVAYSLEVGAVRATGEMTNVATITAPNPQQKIAVMSFSATAAWQDGLRMDVTAWDANNQQLAIQVFYLSFFKPTTIDLRNDLRYSAIYRLTILTSGGQKMSCVAGKQVVIDNIEVYMHVQ